MADVLITGGAGLIGSHFARHSLARGANVHVTVRRHSAAERLADIRADITLHEVDLADADAIAAMMAWLLPKRVFHFATTTRPPKDLSPVDAAIFVERDVSNLLNLVRAMAQAPRSPETFVRAGSLAEYGTAPTPYREDRREAPVTSYGAAALASTQHLHALQSRLPFPLVTARLALVYGPGQSTSFLIPSMIERFLRGEPVTLQNPNDRRDLIYIDDVLDGLERLAERLPLETDVINLCTGQAPRMADVAEIILEETGASRDLLRFGEAGAWGGASHLQGSPDLAARLLDWRSKVDLVEGVRRQVSFMKSQTKISGSSDERA